MSTDPEVIGAAGVLVVTTMRQGDPRKYKYAVANDVMVRLQDQDPVTHQFRPAPEGKLVAAYAHRPDHQEVPSVVRVGARFSNMPEVIVTRVSVSSDAIFNAAPSDGGTQIAGHTVRPTPDGSFNPHVGALKEIERARRARGLPTVQSGARV